MKITDWAVEDRPREKLIQKGTTSLSDAELLGILISSGRKDKSAVDLGRELLSIVENNYSSGVSYPDERLTPEDCHILELLGAADDPAVSLARARVPPGVTMGHIFRGVIPFMILQLVGVAGLLLFPQIATWLPSFVTY